MCETCSPIRRSAILHGERLWMILPSVSLPKGITEKSQMIFTQENEYSAVLDACVLVPAALCDTLLRLAEEPAMHRPLWSEQIMAEMIKALRTKIHRTEVEARSRQQK